MRRTWFVATLVLLGCRDRGTISIPLGEPCSDLDKAYDSVAVYFIQGTCAGLAPSCIDPKTTCDDHDCQAACESGYCSRDELDELAFDPAPGTYAVVVRYHYAGEQTDGAIACSTIHIDADGDQSSTATDGMSACCMEGPGQ